MLFFSGMGQTFMTLEVWAMVMDVTDYHEFRCGRKEEGTVYSIYNFVRKIGHTIAGAGSSVALMAIGYDVNAVELGQSAEVVSLTDDSCPPVITAMVSATLIHSLSEGIV